MDIRKKAKYKRLNRGTTIAALALLGLLLYILFSDKVFVKNEVPQIEDMLESYYKESTQLCILGDEYHVTNNSLTAEQKDAVIKKLTDFVDKNWSDSDYIKKSNDYGINTYLTADDIIYDFKDKLPKYLGNGYVVSADTMIDFTQIYRNYHIVYRRSS